jgi:hypothetical protein
MLTPNTNINNIPPSVPILTACYLYTSHLSVSVCVSIIVARQRPGNDATNRFLVVRVASRNLTDSFLQNFATFALSQCTLNAEFHYIKIRFFSLIDWNIILCNSLLLGRLHTYNKFRINLRCFAPHRQSPHYPASSLIRPPVSPILAR